MSASRWPRTLLALATALVLAGCTAPDGDPGQAPGALRGALVTHIFDFGGGRTLRQSLRLPSGEERPLLFASPPELAPGTVVDVWGSETDDGLAVSRLEVVPAGIASALIDAPKNKTRQWAFVLIDTQGTGNLTTAAAQQQLFSESPGSVRSYYREVSYGIQDLDGQVIGPLKLDATGIDLCNRFTTVGPALRAMVPGTFDQYLWYFESPIRNCDWGGVAILGTAATPTRDSYYNGSHECVVLVQEPGHNFGMVHSSALRCALNGTPVSMVTADAGQCQHDEYGNPFDPMGGGNPGQGQMLNTCYHMNGVQKAYQQWLGGCNVVKATTSGTFTIYPLEKACTGAQVLQIPLPADRVLRFPPNPLATVTGGRLTSYYLELRAPIGLDQGLKTPRVFVLAAGDLKDATRMGNPNWLIDTTPETTTVQDAALAVGKTFVDPAAGGPKFTLVSADATKAVISVELATGGGTPTSPGAGTCLDDSPFTAPGPDACQDPMSAEPTGAGGSPGTGGSGGSSDAGGPGGEGGSSDAAPALPPDASALPPDGPAPLPADAAVSPGDAARPATKVMGAVAGGCGCRLAGRDAGGNTSLVVVLALALALALRRRRAR